MELSPDEKLKRLGLEPEACFIHLKTLKEITLPKVKPRAPTPPGQLMLNIIEAWQIIPRKELLRQMSQYIELRAAAICIEKSSPRFIELGMIKLEDKIVEWKMTPVVERFLANRKDSVYFSEFSELLK
jgi:hypothetical protein